MKKSYLFVGIYYTEEGERCQLMFNTYRGAYAWVEEMTIAKERPCCFIEGYEAMGQEGFFVFKYYEILSWNKGDTCLTGESAPMNRFTNPDEPFMD